MIRDLAHTAFAAHDIDASLAFYAKLGLDESFRLHREDGSLMLVYLHIAGDRFLELFPNGPEPDPNRPQSFRHVCLMTDDLEGDIARFRAAGVAIDREPSLGKDGNLQAWLHDPDGNAIELMQIADHSPQAHLARGETVRETDIIKAPATPRNT